MMPHRPTLLTTLQRGIALVIAALGSLGTFAMGGSSSVVGLYQISIPAGNSAWVAGLVTADDFEDDSVTVSADPGDGKALVTFSSPGWTGSEYTHHYAEPLSGIAAGLAVDILSNTTDTLKLDITPAAAGLTSGMRFVVRKHATLAGLFPDGGGFQPFTDSINLFDASGNQHSYFFNNATQKWIDSIGADSSDVVVRPGQGFVIQAGNAFTATLGTGEVCYVKSTLTRITANAHVANLVGALNPLATTTTLGALGITDSLQAFNDSLVTLTSGTLAQGGTYLSNGSTLISGTGQNASTVPLPAGASVVISVDTQKNVKIDPVTVGP